ncbi:MAG: putative membrane protein [Saprospiraceae bacterium]|jgi:uncharacterized membrane protein
MNGFNHNRIQELIDKGYNFDVGRYISEGFDIVKKDLGLFIGYTLVAILIIGMASTTAGILKFLRPESMAFQFIGQLTSQIVTQLIAPPLMAGFLIAAHKLHKNEILDFGDFFKGFDYYKQLVIQGLIIMGITFALFFPIILEFIIMVGFDINELANLGVTQFAIIGLTGLVLFIVYVYILVSYLFAPAFIVFGQMEAWEALEASRKIVSQNFFPVLGFTLVLGLLIIAGYLACCVGVLFALPAIQAAVYCAFKDIMDFDNPEQGQGRDDIYDHLVDG